MGIYLPYTKMMIAAQIVYLYLVIITKGFTGPQQCVLHGPFVAAFASSNLGDVSPNIRGPHCLNTGYPCDDVTSTCDGQAKYCVAMGPGKDMFESTEIIAKRLFKKAEELWLDIESNSREVNGKVGVVHQFVNMTEEVAEYTLTNGTKLTVRGCSPAMGYSFAAGTVDGPGSFDFKQGTLTENVLWNAIRDFLAAPTADDKKCHGQKPILFATGRIKFPYQWQSSIVSIQLARIGDVFIAAVPGEFTTMAGRRLRSAIADTLSVIGSTQNTKVIIAGLSNVYSDYITTPEEYQLQRYEGASTIFGPHTLTLYLKLYRHLAESLINDLQVEDGPTPPDISQNLISLIPPVLFDSAGWSKEFGLCILQPSNTARPGDIVRATFISGHPRNNVMHGKTFLIVEKLVDEDEWTVVATDADWESKFIWKRQNLFSAVSEATVEWTIGSDVSPGVYRIRHFGYYKYILGGIFPYEGISDNFNVI